MIASTQMIRLKVLIGLAPGVSSHPKKQCCQYYFIISPQKNFCFYDKPNKNTIRKAISSIVHVFDWKRVRKGSKTSTIDISTLCIAVMKTRNIFSRSLRSWRQQNPSFSRGGPVRLLSASPGQSSSTNNGNESSDDANVNIKYISSGLPDFIEDWDRDVFRKIGYGLTAITAASACNTIVIFETQTVIFTAGLGALTGAYWVIGKRDIEQRSHTIRRNFPVLGNMRYLLEMIRPEIRQYVSVATLFQMGNSSCQKDNDILSKDRLYAIRRITATRYLIVQPYVYSL